MITCEKHYDLLIDENNDPVHDPRPLREYMDKWDGQSFIDKLELDATKYVLEIGVGTGRLAVKIAPRCKEFYGIDISSKTIDKAKINLLETKNVSLLRGDFQSFDFARRFDIIYSSLTFMHFEDKASVINKIARLLNDNGRFVLSIDKSQDNIINMETRKIRIFPDTPSNIIKCLKASGMNLLEQYETEFAHIFVATK